MYQRLVDEVFDELTDDYDAEYEQDLLTDLDSQDDRFAEDEFDAFHHEVFDEAVASPGCPGPTREVIVGFPRYQNTPASLPPVEQQKLRRLAQAIVRSYQRGCRPIRVVRLVGHADRDVQRGHPFENRISRERALAVRQELERLISNRAISSRIRWDVQGAGSSQLVAQIPRTEAERRRNRRVEIIFTDGTTPPQPHTKRRS